MEERGTRVEVLEVYQNYHTVRGNEPELPPGAFGRGLPGDEGEGEGEGERRLRPGLAPPKPHQQGRFSRVLQVIPVRAAAITPLHCTNIPWGGYEGLAWLRENLGRLFLLARQRGQRIVHPPSSV